MKRWPLQKAYFWESAPFFRVLLPFAAGIFCYDQMHVAGISAVYTAIAAVLLLLFYTCLVIIKKSNPVYTGFLFAIIYALLFFCGFSVSGFSDITNNKAWFGNKGHGNSYFVRVMDFPVAKEHSWKVPVAVLNCVKEDHIIPAAGNAFLYLYKDAQPMLLHKGDTIIVPGDWRPISNAGNPFEFDYATYCRRNNILYQQSCSIKNIRLYATNDADNAPIAEHTHDWCMQQLDKYITDSTAKGLIQAMLLGDEVNLDEELRQSYTATGIVHIIAISGGNVIIFFSIISILLWWLKDKQHLWIKYAIALPLVWFYVLMAGAPPSAIRAAIMFSLLAFSVMLQQNNSSLNTLFAAAFVLLCGEPMWLFSVGFQLSFTAVLSLILFYKPIYKWLSPAYAITKSLWGAVAASLAAEILTAPLAIYYFHTFPLLFLVANVAAYVFMSIILILSILIILFSFIPVMATGIGSVVILLVSIFDRIVSWLQQLNPVSFHFLMLSGAELLTVYIVLAAISVFFLKKEKSALFIALATGCLFLFCICRDEWLSLGRKAVIVYNTGKANHAELINGKYFSVLCTDTTEAKKIAYAVGPAHISLHAWRQDTSKGDELFIINGKKVLLLHQYIRMTGDFPVDYLIINFTGIPDAAELKRMYAPSVTVIGNNYTQKEQARLVKEFSACGLKLHSIANDGAFILQEQPSN